ncbi:MAG: iron-sulfur cluster insertion protein ErpA [Alphaproteobacteria bacterium]
MTEAPTAIRLSERAARRIAHLIEQEGTPGARLRVAVSGGGCSGFQYGFSLDDALQDDDIVVERNGVGLVIDPMSLMYLTGSEVDFIEEIAGSYFTINNPNATSSCGCGASFGIAI